MKARKANTRSLLALGLVGAIALLAGPLSTAASAQTPPPPAATPAPAKEAVPGHSESIGLCADCHDQAKAFAGNPHVRGASRKGLPAAAPDPIKSNAVCESCHGDGTKHMEAGGDKSLIRALSGRSGAEFCRTCHQESTSHASFSTGMHANSATVNCLTCHSIHKSDPKGAHLNVKPTQELCASCHANQAATIRQKPFTHRPVNGVMDCVSCHDPHGRPGRESLKLTRAGEPPCLTCHSEKRGPFVFEHQPGLSATSAVACLECHEQHGSSNPKMLKRANVFQLCLECHSRIQTDTFGSQPPSFHNISLPRYRNCTSCHVAIHGSNTSPTLFK